VLVVIGIIAILMGLLMPVIVGARREAQSIKCREQMRQLGMVFQMYASSNRGQLGNFVWNTWTTALFPKVDFWPTSACTTAPPEEWISYMYNGYLVDIQNNLNRALHADAPPSEMILLGEKRADIARVIRTNHWQSYPCEVDPLRHGRRLRANYLFLDFHVDNNLPDNPVDPRDPWAIMRYDPSSNRSLLVSRSAGRQ
jgi:prepilin-type processing-associated H-X9-DG protein